jgi:hypothetical protein
VLADAVDVALRVASALEEVGARYFVGGSFASSLDGEPRATNDIDFVIDLKVGKIADFVAVLLGSRIGHEDPWLSQQLNIGTVSLLRRRCKGDCLGLPPV